MITNRITIFAAAAGFLGMAGLAPAKEKAGTPAKEKAGAGMSEYTKGNQFFETKQYEQAIEEFSKAIEANGNSRRFMRIAASRISRWKKGQKQPPTFPRRSS